jgi:hypothetical protein
LLESDVIKLVIKKTIMEVEEKKDWRGDGGKSRD